VARATEEAKAQLENLRPQMVSRCPPAGINSGGVQLVFHFTFDSQGRQTARSVRPRHRARGREIATCLREMDGLELSIQPPGTNVAVAVPMALP
jgi:hypothetical protein